MRGGAPYFSTTSSSKRLLLLTSSSLALASVLGFSSYTSSFLPSSSSSSPSSITRPRRFSSAPSPTQLQAQSLGSMFGKMMGGMLKGPVPPPTDMSNFKDTAPSWTDLAALLKQQQTEEERTLPDLRAKGRGPPSSKASLRLFDAPDGYEPRILLYRDTAAWCPYCEKVWMYLEEKKIPYRVEKVNMRCYGPKPPEFLRLSPTGLLPVAIIDGDVITESDSILQTLEDRFPEGTPLLPLAKDPAAEAVPGLLRLERELFSAWLRWLTGSTVTNERAKMTFESVLGRVETALQARGGPYFLGETFSLIDCIFVPFMERMAATLCYYKAFIMRTNPNYPGVERWFQAMEGRESFSNIKSDWFTHAMDMPPQVGQCWGIPEAEVYAKEIDGRDGLSWTLPLPEKGVEPLMKTRDAAAHKREAAAQLIGNNQAVVKFAARGLGEPGVPPVMAALADPNAKPNEAFFPLLDGALRLVALALLEGPEKVVERGGVGGFVAGEAVAEGLCYLRERVGVPRDMSYEAARQFRGHLGWVAGELRGGKK